MSCRFIYPEYCRPVMICMLSFQKDYPQFGLYPTELYKVSFHMLTSLSCQIFHFHNIPWMAERTHYHFVPYWESWCWYTSDTYMFLIWVLLPPKWQSCLIELQVFHFSAWKADIFSPYTLHPEVPPLTSQKRFRNSACFSKENYRVHLQAN